uniref:Uncharacterized protein n=1 Tax=Arundo donax TaxID=35708 RepID=A0A0A8YTL9_ARUDO
MVYNLCCKVGKVSLPSFKPPPPPLFLAELLCFDGGSRSRTFLEKIRQYNALFSFTSMGASIDRSVNNGGGPPVFKISGQVCHHICSLLPLGNGPPKYAQLYVYDTSNELANRLQALGPTDKCDGDLDPEIVAGLTSMLDEFNPLVKQFRAARDRLAENGNEEIGIRIVGATEDDPVQYELPSANELAGLIVGDFSKEDSRHYS